MGLDIRTPIGVMFSLLGALLTLYGVFGPQEIYAKSLGIRINLWWGLVMLAFGVIMLVLAKRASRRS
jgi:uncharacterized membrane protein